MEQFIPLFSLSAGSIAWIVLASALVGLLAWQVKTGREILRLHDRLTQQSRSIGFMDDWADDVDIRLTQLEAAKGVVNNSRQVPRSQSISFLARKLRERSEAEEQRLSKERADTIMTGSKEHDPK